ncbi:MAG: hypothetical protein ACI9D0_001541 [Bacteroidia bacterium]|jgi:hypothetical protein
MNCQLKLVNPAALLSVALLLITSCGASSEVVIDDSRPISADASFAKTDASSAERFGYQTAPTQHSADDGHDHGAEAPAADPFTWVMPKGWIELPKAQFRDINLQPAGDSELQCYMTILPGGGGSMGANLNRWRGQLGLEPLEESEFNTLPTTVLFRGLANVVQLDGTFTGMGGEPRPNYSMVGVILQTPQFTVTLKLTGPKDKVLAERANFDAFYGSLALAGQTEATAQSNSPASADLNSGDGGELTYALPEGWSTVDPSGMRIINLKATEATQCYLIMMPGNAGGLIDNLNRWRGEVGDPPFGQVAMEALPKIPMLGTEVFLLDVSGDYQGMGGVSGEDQTLLGVCRIDDEASMFVKMVGPASEVAAEKQHFIEFIGSLEN